MTGYERIQAALSGKRADKTPIMLHNFMMAAREAGYTMEQYRNDPKIIADTFIRAVEKYQYDGITVDIDTVTLAGACGVPVDFPNDEPARSHEGLLDSLMDVEQLKPLRIQTYKYVDIWCEAVHLLKQHFQQEIFIRGNCDQAPFSLATMLRGTENLMLDLCLEPQERVFALLDYCLEATTQFVSLMKEAGADMISNGDSPAGPSMMSPEMYQTFALPYEKKVCDWSHQQGLPYLLHICGNTDIILDDMISVGADVLELDYLTNTLVAEKTEELLRIFQDNPRFILNAGCAIPPTTPAENLETMIRVARDFTNV